MNKIVHMKFGAHLYGTTTPLSDIDFKGVYIPKARDILLQRVKGSIVSSSKADQSEKNTAADTDEEFYSLQRFFELLAEGQTNLIDMLFATPDVILWQSWHWNLIRKNRHRFLTRRAAAFVGYCRQQANKYGIKGSRVAAARAALDFLLQAEADLGTSEKLGVLNSALREKFTGMEFVDFGETTLRHEHKIAHWEVCGRKLCYTASIKSARECIERLVAEYGQRSISAEQNKGVDWKALSHAVRVGEEAIELLATGNVTFPRPNAHELVQIKTGALEYAAVAGRIEALLGQVEQAAEKSSLPEKPDHAYIEMFVASVYADEVMATT